MAGGLKLIHVPYKGTGPATTDTIAGHVQILFGSIAAVLPQMKAGRLRTEVRLPDIQGEMVVGQLTFLNNSVADTTGTVNLRATIPNGGHIFWPGRFVNIRLVLNTIHQAVLVPANAPQMSAKGSFVYVVKQDSTAEQRPVTLGQRRCAPGP